MKYLRTFEDISDKPKVGDYVLIKVNLSRTHLALTYHKQLEEYMNNNFGQIININVYHSEFTGNDIVDLYVKYHNIPEEIMDWFSKSQPCKNSPPTGDVFIADQIGYTGYRRFDIDRIVEFAPTEEELKLKLAAKKFNL